MQARNEFNCIVDRVAVLTHATAYCAEKKWSSLLPPTTTTTMMMMISADKKRRAAAALSSLSLFLVGDMFPDLDVDEAVSLFAGVLLSDGGTTTTTTGDHHYYHCTTSYSSSSIADALKKGVAKDDPVRRLM